MRKVFCHGKAKEEVAKKYHEKVKKLFCHGMESARKKFMCHEKYGKK